MNAIAPDFTNEALWGIIAIMGVTSSAAGGRTVLCADSAQLQAGAVLVGSWCLEYVHV